jgi:hypothetical protein
MSRALEQAECVTTQDRLGIGIVRIVRDVAAQNSAVTRLLPARCHHSHACARVRPPLVGMRERAR